MVFKSHLKTAIECRDQGALGTPHLTQENRDSSLPLVLTDDEDIQAICALLHAGQATAVMQVVANPSGGLPLPGLVVSEITPSGWLALWIARCLT
jgi:hypothetical protein